MQKELRRNQTAIVDEDGSALMACVSRGDAVAFAALYDAFQPLIFGIALRMLGSAYAAEDLTQAVFLKVWVCCGQFKGGNLGGWLARVTRNAALDALRYRGVHAEGELTEDIAYDLPLADMVAANLDGETIRSAIVALPPEQREVIELGFFTGASHAEIARVTNTPLGTAKTRIRSGLSTLRRVFETEKICETSRAPDGRRQVSVRNPSAEPTGAPRSRSTSRLFAPS